MAIDAIQAAQDAGLFVMAPPHYEVLQVEGATPLTIEDLLLQFAGRVMAYLLKPDGTLTLWLACEEIACPS